MTSYRGTSDGIWYPYTQMKTAPLPREIVSGSGALLVDRDGNEIIDAISSWWVSIHGHAHPVIAERLYRQALQLEQVIFAGFTHEPARELSGRLRDVLPENQTRVFFSDNGSTAVEVALKMSIQYWRNKAGCSPTLIAFENAYHGDTFGAMSISERGAFVKPFADFLFDVIWIPAPTCGNEERSAEALRAAVSGGGEYAFVFEPLVQGAGGMLMHEPAALDRLLGICHEHDVVTIADEVLTGFGRTGKLFASLHLTNRPRIMCLSKGLTGGTLPMGVTTSDEDLFSAFLSDDRLKTLFHGHSFAGNPIGCAAALASLDILQSSECRQGIKRIENRHAEQIAKFATHPVLRDVRRCGVILALEFETEGSTSYFNAIRDRLYDFYMERNVLLRPLGNVVYVLPPYCTTDQQLDRIYEVIRQSLDAMQTGDL